MFPTFYIKGVRLGNHLLLDLRHN